MNRDELDGKAKDEVVHFRWGLDPPPPLCYICKVLVGPGTPYLGPDSKTRQRGERAVSPTPTEFGL